MTKLPKLPKAGTPIAELRCKKCGKTEAERASCVDAECWHKPKEPPPAEGDAD